MSSKINLNIVEVVPDQIQDKKSRKDIETTDESMAQGYGFWSRLGSFRHTPEFRSGALKLNEI